jgi:hypothetical protein
VQLLEQFELRDRLQDALQADRAQLGFELLER